jgi:uncharacterized delta-60 repeat protein
MKTTLHSIVLAGLALSFTPIPCAHAAPGNLDLSFNGTGQLTTDFGYGGSNTLDYAAGLLVQPDGSIVTAGIAGKCDWGLARYLPNGALDPSFGAGGKVTTSFYAPQSWEEQAFAVVRQGDGKLVAAGSALQVNGSLYGVMALCRYSAGDGSLDTSFGTGGKAIPSDVLQTLRDLNLLNSVAYDVALLPDGRFVAVGTSPHGGINEVNIVLARFTSNGFLDTGFGPGTTPGAVAIDINATRGYSGNSYAQAVALQADGKIVLAGFATPSAGSTPPGTTHDFVVVRLLADGTLDPTFGIGGIVTTDLQGGSTDRAYDVAIQSDGRIVVAGWTVPSGGFSKDFALARYLPNGALDPSFGSAGTGIVITALSTNEDSASSVVLQGDGRIVVGGAVWSPITTEYFSAAVARYLPGGTLDPSFGGGLGWVRTDIGSGGDNFYAVALQADGKIVGAGIGSGIPSGNDADFALARFEGGSAGDTDGDGLPDPWELTYFPNVAGQGALDDPDGDSVVNLLELGAGLNPAIPDIAGLPRPVLENGYLTLTLTKRPGVLYEVVSAGTLHDGQANSFSAASTTILLNTVSTLKVRDNFPIPAPQRFLAWRCGPGL